MSLGIAHLVHANVVCSDFDRSYDFYTRLLGGRVLGAPFEFDAGADFMSILGVTGPTRCKAALLTWSDDDRATYVDLLHFAGGGAAAPRTPTNAGLARLAFRVRDIAETLAFIEEHRIPLVGGPVTLTPLRGRVRPVLAIRDPDGTLINLMQFPELTEQP
ncbi:VOC family protein [Dactylosporangium sp. NPDC050688]|uniref:VOC family protein n=1 Tax=Dactylosporangium sp. NPDC050688 TaxID=3157217 RepID=UPI0033D3884E